MLDTSILALWPIWFFQSTMPSNTMGQEFINAKCHIFFDIVSGLKSILRNMVVLHMAFPVDVDFWPIYPIWGTETQAILVCVSLQIVTYFSHSCDNMLLLPIFIMAFKVTNHYWSLVNRNNSLTRMHKEPIRGFYGPKTFY